MNRKFFIYKTSYSTDLNTDLSFIPMMTRRKLSPLVKCAFSTIYNCFEKDDINLVFASQYGEVDKLNLLIEQYTKENEVSPIAFSSSVHNNTIGTFSLLNKINNKYNAVSAGEYSLSNGLLEAITANETTLFCYADTIPETKSVSCLIGNVKKDNADEIELSLRKNECYGNEYKNFIKFLNKEENYFLSPFYCLRRA